jgi:hypothetical protein
VRKPLQLKRVTSPRNPLQPVVVGLIHLSEQVPHVFALDAEFRDRIVSCRVSTHEHLGVFHLVSQWLDLAGDSTNFLPDSREDAAS